jgi:hypothetical protein
VKRKKEEKLFLVIALEALFWGGREVVVVRQKHE